MVDDDDGFRTKTIRSILVNVLSGLDDDTVIDYMTGMIEETSFEEYKSVLGPFLLSLDLLSKEEEIQPLCIKIQKELMQKGIYGNINNGYEELEIKKLKQTTTIEDLVDDDNELMNMMWGFDKIRKTVNVKLDQKVAQSQRQIRKQGRADKVSEEKELQEAEADLEWENKRILPDMTHNTGEKDIHVANVCISFKGLSLLQDTPLKLISGRRYGFIGANGTGKTTLLRYISKYEIDGFPKHVRIQHVEQESAEKLSLVESSVIQVVLDADFERKCMLDKVKELSSKQDADSQSELSDLFDTLSAMDSDSAESRARTILTGLQFSTDMINGPAANLSGGWRMRAALAGALFMFPDLLLLDEPTNHLDLEAVVWLETYLQSYQNTLVIVSHDRKFLDSVITDVIHLHNKKLIYYKGDYGTFEKTRKETLRTQRKAYDAQQQKIIHMQEFIDRFRSNAKKAPLVQSRVKALAKIELIEEPEDEQAFRMNFPPPEPLGRPIISITDVAFKYTTSKVEILDTPSLPPTSIPPIFTNVNFGVDLSSRIGILGKNGSGKSTLINLMLGKLYPTDGHIQLNPRLRIASFTQHHVDQLNLAKTAVENMAEMFPGHENQEFRNHLGRFNVTGNMAIKRTRQLSGGQKSRVAFAILTWNLPHVIIMDEPTNHLDIETIDALIEALKNFKGGVVIVSHDQHFVNSICEELWVVDNGGVDLFRGSMNDYKKMILK